MIAYFRLIVAGVVLAALALSHLTVYRWGKQNVRTEWLASVAEANADARKLEQQRQRRAADAQALSTTREARIVSDAAAARVAAGGLRNDLDALQRASAQSLDAATKSVAALSSVFADCSRRYQELAEIADRHASDALTLEQAWPK